MILLIMAILAADITVRGSASVSAIPDKVTIVLGVETGAADAQVAVQENGRKVRCVLEALSKYSPKTERFNIFPVKGKFRVSHMVVIKSSEVDRAGKIVQASVSV